MTDKYKIMEKATGLIMTDFLIKEIERATHFYKIQLLKGWNKIEATNQVSGSYGSAISFCVQYNINNF